MARVNAPLLSFSASGKVGKTITFSTRNGGTFVRYQRAQRDFLTSARSLARAVYADCVTAWRDLSSEEKETYRVLARGSHISGYNLFMRECILGNVSPVEDGDFALVSYTVPSGDGADFVLVPMV